MMIAKTYAQTTDVVIIGGGVIGCAIAYYLRKAQIGVTVLEQGALGAQASGAATGLLAPLGPLSGPGPYADLLLSGFRQMDALVPELEESSGLTLDYERTGALRVVRDAKYAVRLQKRFASWQSLGLRLHWLDGEEARRQEPLLTPALSAAIYAPEESQIRAERLVQAYAVAAQHLGADIRLNTAVVGVTTENDTVTGVKTIDGTSIACRYLVCAGGAWMERIGSWLDLAIPVRPLHGQMCAYQQASSPGLRHMIFGDAAYIAPRGTEILVGATREETGFEVAVTAKGQQWLHTTAQRLLPSLTEQTVVRRWAGLRPVTPDKRPLLGPVPGWQNVLLAAGHNSVGMMLSPISGQAITYCITTGSIPANIQPFTLARFLPLADADVD